jgi:hypothetical protein
MVDRVGKGLIIEKKQALFNAAGEEKDSIDSSQMVGKDLLSLLSEWLRYGCYVFDLMLVISQGEHGERLAPESKDAQRRSHGS